MMSTNSISVTKISMKRKKINWKNHSEPGSYHIGCDYSDSVLCQCDLFNQI